jgi:hypothetical protein
VFDIWQSDLPRRTNSGLIRRALTDAANRLNTEFAAQGLSVVVDHATRNMPGSRNIPLMIQEKIRAADALVADVTTINGGAVLEGEAAGQVVRPVANPNVLFELGFGVALLGWDRTITLFNTAEGRLDRDLAFDFATQRISRYEAQPQGQLAVARSALGDLLFLALKEIIEQNPPRPADVLELSPEQRRRQHDVGTLRELLRCVDWGTMDMFLDTAPNWFLSRIFHFQARFRGFVEDSLFHLHDRRLLDLVTAVHERWDEALSFGDYYDFDGHERMVWHRPLDLPYQNAREERARIAAAAAVAELRQAITDLLRYVRDQFPEIDPAAASRDAWEAYIAYQARLE